MRRKILMLALCLLITGCGPFNSKESTAVQGGLSAEPISPESLILEDSSFAKSVSTGEASAEFSPEREKTAEEELLPSIKKLFTTALLPLGETAYVWGGGWNEEDTGAGIEARTLGVSPSWKAFADTIPATYDHSKYRYQIHDGLDCSGYVGWVVYNVFETENNKEGYVFSSTKTAETYASYGWGDYLTAKEVKNWKPGDVASMQGHVWLCLGTCADGSVLLIHSSPPGVRICGTTIKNKPSDASKLAEVLMKEHYPAWYERFPECEVSQEYLSAAQMRWNEETMPDAKLMQSLSAEEIAALLFP